MPDARELESHRTALTGHCYRMLGSIAEADDAVQETMLRAWRSIERFDGRSTLKTWLVRIATNVCLDALRDERRRVRPIDEAPHGTIDDELIARPREHWIEPAPDARAFADNEADPARRLVLRDSLRLAFVAALQELPAKQRAALLLADVLEWPAAEVAEALELTPAAVNSALQRARATLATRGVRPEHAERAVLAEREEQLLTRFVAAFEAYDVEALAHLCREDVVFSMPPYALWLVGPASVRGWLNGRGAGCRGSRLVRTSANGGLAYAQYKRDHAGSGYRAWGIGVLELVSDGAQIARWTTFLDVETLFPRFGFALELPP